MDKWSNNIGKVPVLLLDVTGLTFLEWNRKGPAASARLPETLFSIKACIMSLVPRALQQSSSFRFLQTGCTMGLGSVDQMISQRAREGFTSVVIPLFKMSHHLVAKKHAKPQWLRGCFPGFKCYGVFPTVLTYGYQLYPEVASSFPQRQKLNE